MLQCDSKLGKYDVPLMFKGERSTWYRPVSIDQLVNLKREIPNLKIVSGNTEVGVEANILGKYHQSLCYVADIQILKNLQTDDSGKTISKYFITCNIFKHNLDLVKKNWF